MFVNISQIFHNWQFFCTSIFWSQKNYVAWIKFSIFIFSSHRLSFRYSQMAGSKVCGARQQLGKECKDKTSLKFWHQFLMWLGDISSRCEITSQQSFVSAPQAITWVYTYSTQWSTIQWPKLQKSTINERTEPKLFSPRYA